MIFLIKIDSSLALKKFFTVYLSWNGVL